MECLEVSGPKLNIRTNTVNDFKLLRDKNICGASDGIETFSVNQLID